MVGFQPHLVHDSLSQPAKWHLDRFVCFCTAHSYEQQTDIQIMLHEAASYALSACDVD